MSGEAVYLRPSAPPVPIMVTCRRCGVPIGTVGGRWFSVGRRSTVCEGVPLASRPNGPIRCHVPPRRPRA